MNLWSILAAIGLATGAAADVSCTLQPAQGAEPATLLVREIEPDDEAVMLVSGRTMLFDCPAHPSANAMECYGHSGGSIKAPTQMNVAADTLGPGAIVVVSTRNMFFGKNEHIGYHRRHSSVHVFTVQTCEKV
ncbi:hypothetical protein LCL97_10490 [Seohaeicola saemankumensis]|nr:hypothetical protein [Seohaeicola saemankumensis]MCA0871258.1 hypothetical protein [Seohaeicola saemankumensis]